MKHVKHETKTTRHVVTLEVADIEDALREYVLRKLAISAHAVRNVQAPYYQAHFDSASSYRERDVNGPMSSGSGVQVVFDEVPE